MKWRRGQRNQGADYVEDRRGQGGRMGGMPGGLVIPVGGGAGGVLLLCLLLVLGGGSLLGGGSSGADVDGAIGGVQSPRSPGAGPVIDPDAETVEFVRFVVNDIQSFWGEAFQRGGQRYQPARLVLFEDVTQAACGGAQAQFGPHYCPEDRQVYLDLSFFRELNQRFDAPGDFAQAYVIAHEYGHHIQNITGVLPNVNRAQQQNPHGRTIFQCASNCKPTAWPAFGQTQSIVRVYSKVAIWKRG